MVGWGQGRECLRGRCRSAPCARIAAMGRSYRVVPCFPFTSSPRMRGPRKWISRGTSARTGPPLTEGRAKPTQRRLRDMDVAKATISTRTYCRGGPPGAWGCAREVRLRRTRMSGQAFLVTSLRFGSPTFERSDSPRGETRSIRACWSGACTPGHLCSSCEGRSKHLVWRSAPHWRLWMSFVSPPRASHFLKRQKVTKALAPSYGPDEAGLPSRTPPHRRPAPKVRPCSPRGSRDIHVA
ncbi:hypothetical protein PKB_5744 [Pseudomonas knackmussii B13]|uniref:Uncharacterized protein n=1 Tax=Pseudomonas knackmussii (strain DSM 6978 / CCUG 54928 / LMG 23759 / B13) TaxID=1301098 RepID=A0A024HQQ2_PSEKB|nr:hypothetical protein PKB_5744 [Pseudomonas knackmussii B13]